MTVDCKSFYKVDLLLKLNAKTMFWPPSVESLVRVPHPSLRYSDPANMAQQVQRASL